MALPQLTLREKLSRAILARLHLLEGVTVERNRDVAVANFPALVLFTGGHQVRSLGPAIDQYTMTVIVEGFVVHGSGDGVAAALNDLYGRTVSHLAADPTLGDLAEDLRETQLGEDYSQDASRHYGHFELTLECLFACPAGDPFARA